MLSLGRYSRWTRRELREMTPEEFASYAETASELESERNGP